MLWILSAKCDHYYVDYTYQNEQTYTENLEYIRQYAWLWEIKCKTGYKISRKMPAASQLSLAMAISLGEN